MIALISMTNFKIECFISTFKRSVKLIVIELHAKVRQKKRDCKNKIVLSEMSRSLSCLMGSMLNRRKL